MRHTQNDNYLGGEIWGGDRQNEKVRPSVPNPRSE